MSPLALQQYDTAKEKIAVVFRCISPYVGLDPEYDGTMVALVQAVEQGADKIFDDDGNQRTDKRNLFKQYAGVVRYSSSIS